MQKKESILQKPGTRSILASLISIFIGLAAGAVVMLIVGVSNETIGMREAWKGIRLVVAGVFTTGTDMTGELIFGFNANALGNMLFRATPIILTGLSVAVAYKAGLFNIGASGQYLAGTAASLYVALSLSTGIGRIAEYQIQNGIPLGAIISPGLVWLLAFLAGIAAGAVWGSLPGLLKALLNINEVLACIMTNWLAANLVTWIFDESKLKNIIENTKTSYIYKTEFNGVATSKMGLDKLFPGSQINGGILIAIVFCVIFYIIMTKTTLGYELRVCGANRYAARYAGIQDRRNIVLSMAIAGALSGAAGALYYLSGNTEFFWNTYQSLPAEGFNGIPVALLANCHPIGVIFAGIFMSFLDINGLQLTNLTNYNEYITGVIIAAIVYLSAFSLVIKMWIGSIQKKRSLQAKGSTAALSGGDKTKEETAS